MHFIVFSFVCFIILRLFPFFVFYFKEAGATYHIIDAPCEEELAGQPPLSISDFLLTHSRPFSQPHLPPLAPKTEEQSFCVSEARLPHHYYFCPLVNPTEETLDS